jgi:hypothetical protein
MMSMDWLTNGISPDYRAAAIGPDRNENSSLRLQVSSTMRRRNTSLT